MPYNIKQVGDKFAVVATNTGKVVGTHPSKKKAQAQLAALYANVEDVKKERGTVAQESSANSGRISGGVGWKIEFNTPDCQHGWSVIKVGSGQSIGCFFKEEDAKAALEALAVTEPIVKASWDGVFAPVKLEKNYVRKCMTCGCDDLGNDHHYISDTEKCMYCMSKGQGPCWDGYEYAGTKQKGKKTVPNCIPIKKAVNPTPTKDSTSIWDGVFVPVGDATSGTNYGSLYGDTGWMSTYNSHPQNDGKPSVGYGNHSDSNGRSNQ
jgi:hypothetical protein